MSLVFGGKMSFEPNFDQCFVGMSDFAKGNPANVADVVHPAWVSKYAGKRRRIVNAAVSADDLRCRSLLILKLILESNPVATMLGQQLDSLRENKQFEKIWQVLEDACSDKSTGTLYKRTRTLWSYFGWLRDTGRSKLFVLDEELAYDYMVYARAKGKAATHGQSVLESFGGSCMVLATLLWRSLKCFPLESKESSCRCTSRRGRCIKRGLSRWLKWPSSSRSCWELSQMQSES